MQTKLHIAFHQMGHSPAIEADVRDRFAKLKLFFDRIVSTRVVIEAPHQHQLKGKLYAVRIEMAVPGREIVVSHKGRHNPEHADIKVALRDAFAAAGRMLEDHARRGRGEVKTHTVPPHGQVARLFPDYGFITTSDGREVYFHRNSVTNDGFTALAVGAEVRFVEAEGESEKGPQASTVTAVGRHHIIG
ncbi:MAG: HPF/RaiA family ribosome-associated protein [Alphaproteobacteria bacterium]|nr:HPF/RaiA family ribosome-associated protein [Alphaproteobacteria bacterium]